MTFPLLFPFVHRKFVVEKSIEPLSVSGGTVFPCIVMHFNHRVSQPVEVRTISKLANHHHDRTTNRQLTMISAFEKTPMKCPLASTTGSDDTRRDKNSSNTTDRLVSFSTCYTTCNLFSTCLQVVIWPSSQHVVEDCELVAAADRRQLRSLDIAMFVIPRTYTRSRRSRIHTCWTTNVEQPSVQPTTV